MSRVTVVRYDGSILHGRLHAIEDDCLYLDILASSRTIMCKLEGTRLLRFAGNAAGNGGTAGLDTMEVKGGKLHGRVVTLPSPQPPLGWQPAGSTSKVSIVKPCKVTLTPQRTDAVSTRYPAEEYPDMLFLTNGDMLPCRAVSVDDKFLYVHLAIVDCERVAQQNIQAVELGVRSPSNRQCIRFTDRQWRLVGGEETALSRTEDCLTVHKAAIISGHKVLEGKDIQFDLEWNAQQPVELALCLFCHNDPLPDDSTAIKLGLLLAKGQILVHMYPLSNRAGTKKLAGCKARLRIKIESNTMFVSVNGKRVSSMPVRKAQLQGHDIVLLVEETRPSLLESFFRSLAKLAPNNNAPAPPRKSPLVVLSNFSVAGQIGNISGKRIKTDKKQALLTVPRAYRKRRPTHALIAKNGDLLRGHLKQITADTIRFVSRRQEIVFPRARLAAIVWLRDARSKTPWPTDTRTVQVRFGEISLTLVPRNVTSQNIIGQPSWGGHCRIPRDQIRTMYFGDFRDSDRLLAYADWRLHDAKPPKHELQAATTSGSQPGANTLTAGRNHPLVGKQAANVVGPLVGGGRFDLAKARGKVVVLDFWATWCGPCVRSLPGIMQIVESLDARSIQLVGVNVQQPKDAVASFLQQRGWRLPVLLDSTGDICRKFHVNGIPQTVVIGTDGVIERVFVGALDSAAEEQLKAVLKKLSADATKSSQ